MSSPQETKFESYVVNLNGRAWGIALGLLCGFGLFLATVFLLIKGGDDVGQHLNLLGQYFPFYRVTWPGAFLGFIYAFVTGYAIGRLICLFYNAAAKR